MKSDIKSLVILNFCVLILCSSARAQEVSIADSLHKYKFLAKTAREKKEYDEAIRCYSEILEYRPEDLKAAFFLGDMYYRKKNFDAARATFRRAVALDSLHLNSNLRLYAVYQAAGEVDSAAWSLERVLLKKPEAAEYRRRLADLYRHQGQSERAIHHYEHLAAVGGGDGELFEMLAVLHQELGQMEQSLAWRHRLVGDREGAADHLESIVELQLETGDVKGAYASLLELARVDSQNAYAYYNRIAAVAAENDDDSMRLSGLRGMVEANPRDLESIAILVQWYLARDEMAAANTWLDKGLKVDPDDGHLLLLKGDELVRGGDEAGAIAVFEKARSNPAWAEVAQQRIWQLRPPESEEEKLKRQFFGGAEVREDQN